MKNVYTYHIRDNIFLCNVSSYKPENKEILCVLKFLLLVIHAPDISDSALQIMFEDSFESHSDNAEIDDF